MTTSRWLLVATLLAACGDVSSPDAASDPADADAVVDGKTDDLFKPCQLDAVVELLNGGIGVSELRDGGVNRRAATELVRRRDGRDRRFGTADDRPFADIEAVDAVPYVGPASLRQLVGLTAACESGGGDLAAWIAAARGQEPSDWASTGGEVEGEFRDQVVEDLTEALQSAAPEDVEIEHETVYDTTLVLEILGAGDEIIGYVGYVTYAMGEDGDGDEVLAWAVYDLDESPVDSDVAPLP